MREYEIPARKGEVKHVHANDFSSIRVPINYTNTHKLHLPHSRDATYYATNNRGRLIGGPVFCAPVTPHPFERKFTDPTSCPWEGSLK